MCGRYVLAQLNLEERFHATMDVDRDLNENYNVAPSQTMPTITRNSPNKVTLMKWGLIPFWAKDPRIGFKMINARADGIESKPSFRKPFKSQRCLIPATGFYEWKREEKQKTPYYIFLKDVEVFAFAGLYDIWKDAEGKETLSYTIITTSPNKLMEKIHDRMPVILHKEDEDIWLNKDSEAKDLLKLLKPYDGGMDAYVVSSDVNSPRNNSDSLIEKI